MCSSDLTGLFCLGCFWAGPLFVTLFAKRGPPACHFHAIPPLRCQRKRPRTIPSPLLQFLPRHLSLEQNRRRAQQPPSPGEPPPLRGPYSCIRRRCPLREPLPLRSRSPFPSPPPLPPSRRRRRTLFFGTFRLARC